MGDKEPRKYFSRRDAAADAVAMTIDMAAIVEDNHLQYDELARELLDVECHQQLLLTLSRLMLAVQKANDEVAGGEA